jgi:drug/metabolite transporter (DMT)-like permease
MNTPQLAALTTIVAEIALALHPILIKQINVGLPTQLLARLGTYTILGTALSSKSEREFSWGNTSTALKSIVFGLMNLVHIASSYLSYKHLPAGSALALFYTYPFFNILAGVLFLGDSLAPNIILLMAIAFIGVMLIANYTKDGNGGKDSEKKNTVEDFQQNTAIGVGASLISAITETMIFLIAKTGEEKSPWLTILKLYPAAFLGIIAWIGFSGADWKTSAQNWIPLILFNVFIGFLGYSLRFWSIPRLSTAIFSVLTFIGVAAGYAWGLVYAKEVPSLGALTGAGLITASIGFLKGGL